MNNPTCTQALPIHRKVKKKQVKNELDRIKQAEKKKRRLEKALATSAAIRAELEKKKQKKKEEQIELYEEEAARRQKMKDELDCIEQAEKQKMHLEKALAIRAELERTKQKRLEEQQRLDEEGAAIAEAVALHVLLGEDANDQCQIMFDGEKGFNPNINMYMGGRAECIPHHACSSYAVRGIGFLSNAYGLVGNNSSWSLPYEPFRRDRYEPCSEEGGWGQMGLFSADLIVAQAVSSLQISENAEGDAIFCDGMFRGMTLM
ncbi:PREDICTED: LOW QUALITY PROTEIN: stress response protein NST1-like [Tarenaya hassleriana]|uniref:LOW QUALITY PROTEIN: stress response protein NST1-like n=1 Tax=Tarenaya hassleriana TaxID=28532 RepID=UPI00053C30D8|nr:PREDICTED: LOW QUALITY PROTEIN: stress response protein NST1-like [Tarenaya hassleriana]